MSAGMAYEAMNNAGAMNSRLIVILNDNDMSIAPPVGAMSAYLSQLISSKPFLSVRQIGRALAKRFPRPIELAAKRAEEYARRSEEHTAETQSLMRHPYAVFCLERNKYIN